MTFTPGHLEALDTLRARIAAYGEEIVADTRFDVRLDAQGNMRAEATDTDGMLLGDYVYVDADGHPHGTRRTREQIRPDRWYIHAETGMSVHGADALERDTPVHGLTSPPPHITA